MDKKPKTYTSVNQMAASILKINKFINSSSIYDDPEYYSDGKIYEIELTKCKLGTTLLYYEYQ